MSAPNALQHNPLGRLTGGSNVERFGRAGWFAKGTVYAVAGVLALIIAGKAAGWSRLDETAEKEASPTGALKTIAQASGGEVLMWVLAAGMLTYAAWRLVTAALPGGTDAMAWVKRVGYVVSAIVYITFAVTAISLARGSTSETDGNGTVRSLSADVMAYSGGRILIGLAGLVTIGAGLFRIAKGLKVDVTDELDLSTFSPLRRLWTKRLGAVGEVGRGIGIALVGFFLLRGAITYDRAEATGLDGALRRLATETWGQVVVVLVGLGFLAYGLFCLATFTRRELQAP